MKQSILSMLLLLTATAMAVAGQPEANAKPSKDHTLIVRFDRSVTKEQAIKKMEKAPILQAIHGKAFASYEILDLISMDSLFQGNDDKN